MTIIIQVLLIMDLLDLIAIQKMDIIVTKTMGLIAIYQLDITAHMRMMDKLLSSVNIV